MRQGDKGKGREIRTLEDPHTVTAVGVEADVRPTGEDGRRLEERGGRTTSGAYETVDGEPGEQPDRGPCRTMLEAVWYAIRPWFVRPMEKGGDGGKEGDHGVDEGRGCGASYPLDMRRRNGHG